MAAPTIRAIKTNYKGILFQSTLEADWAKNLDKMRIIWEYEPEGVKLPDGQNYRPDFYLPMLTTWFEVKGPHNERLDKIHILAESCTHAPGCLDGNPETVLDRDDSSCECGFGPDFPWRYVLIGRPAISGRMSYESAIPGSATVLLECPVCRQTSFIDRDHSTRCRRCYQDATGGRIYKSGSKLFERVEPPRGRSRGPKK